ncbi:MAG: hypothetical protein E6J39_05820 [Chloroflexi bacterium]|nr:MAG: hypothetical protein E6J39_05820 [Chloroflexota bacterium]
MAEISPARSAAGEAQILYLEPDDEIPSVVRRVRESEVPRVVLVAPGRSKATSSSIGLRLLARHANEVGIKLSLVADPAARTLAADAGIPAFASIADAQAEAGDPEQSAQPAPRPLAAIHVVRGEGASPPAMPVVHGLAPEGRGSQPSGGTISLGRSRIEDTQPVPVVPPVGSGASPSTRAAARPTRSAPLARRSWTALAAFLGGLVVVAGLVAAVLPSATVQIVPSATSIGPVDYVVTMPAASDSGRIDRSLFGNATGTYDVGTARAGGTVTFFNYTSDSVQVPKGTLVAAGDQAFATNKTINVPATGFFFAGRKSVDVTATSAGTGGNVAAHAINRVVDRALDDRLSSGFPQIGPRVDNQHSTSGGTSKTGPQVTQADVDGLVRRLKQQLTGQLDAQLADHPERTYAPPSRPQDPQVTVPTGLVGTKDKATFQLSGSLAYDRRYVTGDQLKQAASEQLSADSTTVPDGTMLVPSSVQASARNPQLLGDLVSTSITVRGAVTRRLDAEALKRRIAGLSADEVPHALADLGAARVTFWPGWVNAVPRLPFRIDIRVEGSVPSASPGQASAS